MTKYFELAMFAARTQARITYWLLGLFGALMFALLIVSMFGEQMNDKVLSILDRIITAMLPIVGTAIGFWMARQRNETEKLPPEGSPLLAPVPPAPGDLAAPKV